MAMTKDFYANNGWLYQSRDRMASIRSEKVLRYEAQLLLDTAPTWVKERTREKFLEYVNKRASCLREGRW